MSLATKKKKKKTKNQRSKKKKNQNHPKSPQLPPPKKNQKRTIPVFQVCSKREHPHQPVFHRGISKLLTILDNFSTLLTMLDDFMVVSNGAGILEC